jgi:NADH:ubiquinone oxidoreductase subunit 3 (subunit A)
MLQSYLPAIVFLALGTLVGTAFTVLNTLFGPKRSSRTRATHDDPYECGLPS